MDKKPPKQNKNPTTKQKPTNKQTKKTIQNLYISTALYCLGIFINAYLIKKKIKARGCLNVILYLSLVTSTYKDEIRAV